MLTSLSYLNAFQFNVFFKEVSDTNITNLILFSYFSYSGWYFSISSVLVVEAHAIDQFVEMYGLELVACEKFCCRYICGQHGIVTLEKQWQSRTTPFAYQTIVKVSIFSH